MRVDPGFLCSWPHPLLFPSNLTGIATSHKSFRFFSVALGRALPFYFGVLILRCTGMNLWGVKRQERSTLVGFLQGHR